MLKIPVQVTKTDDRNLLQKRRSLNFTEPMLFNFNSVFLRRFVLAN